MRSTSPLELYNPKPLPLGSRSQTDCDHTPNTFVVTVQCPATREVRHLTLDRIVGILKRDILSNHRKVSAPDVSRISAWLLSMVSRWGSLRLELSLSGRSPG